jgi:hypothetical protein
MNKTDQREKIQQRIAEDFTTLKSMQAEDDTLLRGYLEVIVTGKKEQAREMLSLLSRLTDNITRLENLEQGSTGTAFHYDKLAYQWICCVGWL